jgi:hypothetical protein
MRATHPTAKPGTRKTGNMKNIVAPILAATIALSASTAFAGGPVMIAEEPEVVAEQPASSVGILPLLLVGVVLCVALCGNSSNGGRREEPVVRPGEK